jgi:K319-like protein
VALNALGSHDPDGDPLRYEWIQVRGNPVSLLDPNTPRATFVAPKVSEKRLLRFRLRVTDMRGPDTVKGADSLPAFVDVWIEP